MNTTGEWSARLDGVSSPAERQVAAFLIRAGARAAPMTAREMAAQSGTSDATVVRTAKSLGFDSLRALRQALSAQSEPDIASRFHATVGAGPGAGAHQVLDDAAVRLVENVEELQRRLDPADFDAACTLLGDAPAVWWSGAGPSASIAEYAAFLSRRHGLAAGALTHAGFDHADELLCIGSGHVVVLLAYGRIHRHVRVLLAHAAAVGAHVVLVTDVLGPRLDAEVAVRLDAGRGAPARFASHAQTVVLVESLVMGAAGANMPRSEGALRTLNSLRHELVGAPIDVDPA